MTASVNSRFGHIPFDPQSVAVSQELMSYCNKLEALMNKLAFSTARNTGLVRLEEFAMWANKAVREAQLERRAVQKPTLKEAIIIKKAFPLKGA